jgi:hypothetical protein
VRDAHSSKSTATPNRSPEVPPTQPPTPQLHPTQKLPSATATQPPHCTIYIPALSRLSIRLAPTASHNPRGPSKDPNPHLRKKPLSANHTSSPAHTPEPKSEASPTTESCALTRRPVCSRLATRAWSVLGSVCIGSQTDAPGAVTSARGRRAVRHQAGCARIRVVGDWGGVG